MLSDNRVNEFLDHGFTMVPDFFNAAETRLLQQEVRRMLDAGCYRNVATEGDGETHTDPDQGVNLQVVPIDRVSEVFRVLPFHDKVAGAVGQLLGDPVYKILDQSFYKPARIGLPTNWHQDNAYFRLDDPIKGTAMWIAIDDSTAGNGTMKVVPDVFRESFEHYRDPHSDHHIRMDVDEAKAVHCELPAGGVVFFCYGTPHATGPNPSETGRTGVGIHFLNGRYVDRDRMAQGRWQAAAVTGVNADGGAALYGVDARGHFEAMVRAA